MTTSLTRVPARASRRDPGTAPTVLAIVVTHAGRRWLKDCLVALNMQTYSALDVLVVDDASPDWRRKPHLKRVVKRHMTRRRWGFLRTRRSLGFGGAINWALSRVRTDADLLLFVHDDAVLDARSVERMVERVMLDESIAIVGPKVVGWEDPQRLEEVGMAVDRFGYPYKGLERDEIDLGQHDTASEVFFVTSTCMLMRHGSFRNLRGWDARMGAFSEDLDLCWRARVAGYSVMVEPSARARHAIALATGQRGSRYKPTRYFIRRNRLRTVAKNVSTLRLLGLVPQFVLLAFAEMLGFAVLRQPGEILNIAKALGWNLLMSPQTFSERLKVQRARKVPDRRLRRLTVRESTRLRSYVFLQAERFEQAWGRRTEVVARRSAQARGVSRSLHGWPTAAALALLGGLVLGLRHFLLSPPVTVGELLPYPEAAGALWRAYVSPWRDVGLGQPGPSSPALVLLGAFPWIALGSAAVAQKLLVLALGATAFVGSYRLLSEVGDRHARLAAGLVYSLGPIGYAGIRQGALAALTFGAVAPFALHSLLRVTGWVRRPGWERGRALARVALGTAVCAAFVPGSLILLAAVAALLGGLRVVLGPRASALRGLAGAAVGLALGWLLLLPWSGGWFEPGGPLQRLLAAEGDVVARGFSGHGMLSVLLGQTPEGPPLLGLGVSMLAVIALALAGGQRRRLALVLTGVVALCGLYVSLVAAGRMAPLVASPVEAGALASAAFAGLAGLAVAAFRLDLPRRRLGAAQALSLAALTGAAALVIAGIVPALWRGEWTPGRGERVADARDIAQIRSVLSSGGAPGSFRTLWVGESWNPAVAGSARPAGRSHLVTGSSGQSLTDLFERSGGEPGRQLAGIVASIESGETDVGGRLLGTFNILYVIVDRGPGSHQWLGQRDLAVIRTEPGYLLFYNSTSLPRAGVYASLPPVVGVLAGNDPASAAGADDELGEALERRSASSFSLEDVQEGRVAWLAESRNERWRATIEEGRVRRIEAGWGNAFSFEATDGGRLTIGYGRSGAELAALFGAAFCWLVVFAVAFSSARPRHGAAP